MANRSPILGYNHNFRHRGLVFHVQTEDSGVENPHVFTHLFHGGVILTSRKLDYDAEAAEDVVKSLMQAQHRAVLRDLKRGAFDDKIDAYLGGNPDLQPPETEAAEEIAAAEAADAQRAGGISEVDRITRAAVEVGEPEPPRVAARATEAAVGKRRSHRSAVSDAFDAVRAPEPVEAEESGDVAEIHSPAPVSAPRPPGERAQPPGAYAHHGRSPERIDDAPTQRVQRRPPATGTEGRRRPARDSGRGVVVSRPAVIVGAPPQVVGGRKAREEQRPPEGLFGQDLISEKSLDEVILAYLSEDTSEE